MITENIRKQLADYRKHGKKLILQERRVIDRIININKSVPAGYLVCSSYRIYWQQSCSDLYSSQEYCKYPVLAHSAAITVSLPIRSANQIFQF